PSVPLNLSWRTRESQPSLMLLLNLSAIHVRINLQKRLIDGFARFIQAVLHHIDELVQTGDDDVVDRSEVELRSQAAELLLGAVAECAFGCAGDGMERFLGPANTIAKRPRKISIEQQEVDHLVWLNAAVLAAVHLERAG